MGNPINYGDSVWVVDMSIGNGSNTYLQSDASITGGTTSLWQIESYNGESGQVSTSKGMLLKTTSGYLYATESQQVTIAPFQVGDPGFIWTPIVVSGGDGLSTDSQFRLQAGNSKAGKGQYLFLTHGTGRPASLKSDSANGATSDIWVFKVASAASGQSPTPSPNPTPSPSPTPSPTPSPNPTPSPSPPPSSTPSPNPTPSPGPTPSCEASRGCFSTQEVWPSAQCRRWRYERDASCSDAANSPRLRCDEPSFGTSMHRPTHVKPTG